MKKFKYATRLNSFKARGDLYNWKYNSDNLISDLIERAEKVKGLDRIALNYPEHVVTPLGVAGLRERLQRSSLKIDALNSRFNSNDFYFGALSNPDKSLRIKAVDICKRGIDACRELGSDHFILWLSEDGFDYPFQADLVKTWEYEIEGIREIAQYGNDLKISIEYKPFEPRKVSLLANLGTTIVAINSAGCNNLGITLDYCHLLMGNEYPALSLVLSQSINKLYGVHLNDGFGLADDGLMTGSVSTIQTMEFIYYLLRNSYDGVIYFDTFPIREDPVFECESNILWVETIATRLEEKMEVIQNAQNTHDAISLQKILYSLM